MDYGHPKRPAVELRHFRYFIAVAEDLHFGRAAARLNIVQPALTAQIKALELLIGAELLDRTKRRVELTDAGRQFLKESYIALSTVDDAIRAARNVARGAVGKLRIGYGANAAVAGLISSSIRKFRIRWPDVSIDLKEMASSEVSAALGRREIDIGYAAATAIDQREILVRSVGRWPWLLAVSQDHRLRLARSASLDDIAAENFAVYAETEGRLDFSSIVAALPNLRPDQVHQSSHIISLMTYVASGLGVAFVPEPISRLDFPGVAYIEVEGSMPEMEMNLLWPRQGGSAVVENFIACLEA
jgi:DNA-binding transcriptional LysR family regulator